jgi:hypothetical protein
MSKEKTPAELLQQYNKGKKRQMTPEQIRRAVTNRDWTFEGASEERNAIARRVKQAIDDAKLLLQSGQLTETQKKDLQDAFKPVDDSAIVGPILGNKKKMSQLVNLEGSILLLKEKLKMPRQTTKKRGSVGAYQPDPKKQCVLKL